METFLEPKQLPGNIWIGCHFYLPPSLLAGNVPWRRMPLGSGGWVGQTARVAAYVAGRTKGRAMFVCLALSELHPPLSLGTAPIGPESGRLSHRETLPSLLGNFAEDIARWSRTHCSELIVQIANGWGWALSWFMTLAKFKKRVEA